MTFEDYEKAAVSTAIYPGRGDPTGLMYVALKMNGEAGELAEHVGKAMRDDKFGQPIKRLTGRDVYRLTAERRDLIEKEIGDVLWYLAAAAKEIGTDLSSIAQKNIDKLADRAARGKLSGSGDNR